jgi:superfamily II RNA helicase
MLSPFVRTHNLSVAPEPSALPPHPYTFPLDPFQAYAFQAIAAEENVLVCAKTGSGKTLVGEYQIHHSLQKGKRVFYTTPIKSLTNQKYHDLKTLFPDATVGIMTGDIKFCPHAQLIVMTTEILRNLLYKQGTVTENLGLTASLSLEDLDAVIFDECHYMNDPDRGKVWEETMMYLEPEIRLVLLSATLDQPERIASWLGDIKRHPIHLIQTFYRIVPLTHYVLDRKGHLLTLMGPSETYQERVYADWLRGRRDEEKEHRDFQQRVREVKATGAKGGVENKPHMTHYLHRLNQTVQMLEEKELLPALVFVFSRKKCEMYAHHMERSLLDTSDSATVRHILGFHLHRYRAELEQTPQYYQLVELLYRGIAFHHSGLLPILKEAVELLFARGFVKLLFCTETFAVGLNMPTKTVVFTGLKKYDDQTEGLRVVRTDEYFQMAGRAGRRGKDVRGTVLYVPEEEPLTVQEMYGVMRGSAPAVVSRMMFHVDFVLKTIHASSGSSASPPDWQGTLEKTYWYQERQRQEADLRGRKEEIEKKLALLPKQEPYWSETRKVREVERRIRQTVNAQRKELQRQLDTLRNRQMGPIWKKVAMDVQEYEIGEGALSALKEEEERMGAPLQEIEQSLGFLRAVGFVEKDQCRLTTKGILATEVNEGHPLLLTEFYLSKHWNTFSDRDWVTVLCVFLEDDKRASEETSEEERLSPSMEKAIAFLEDKAYHLSEQEEAWCGPRTVGWELSWSWVGPMGAWYDGVETSASICQRYSLFEGNFYRTLLSLTNLVNEVISMATYCEHVEQADQLTRVSERLRRSQWTGESLYLTR